MTLILISNTEGLMYLNRSIPIGVSFLENLFGLGPWNAQMFEQIQHFFLRKDAIAGRVVLLEEFLQPAFVRHDAGVADSVSVESVGSRPSEFEPCNVSAWFCGNIAHEPTSMKQHLQMHNRYTGFV